MYVAFEGAIAAGKTTFAKLFSKQLGRSTQLILEDYDGNPFLRDFYVDERRWALPMQLEFLMSRYAQFSNVKHNPGNVVADHTFAKDRIFANLLLSERELALYEHIAASLSMHAIAPDVVVFLDAPTDILLERIVSRDRDYETKITPEYLDSLRAAYDIHFSKPMGARVIRVDTSRLVPTSGDITRLWEDIGGEMAQIPSPV